MKLQVHRSVVINMGSCLKAKQISPVEVTFGTMPFLLHFLASFFASVCSAISRGYFQIELFTGPRSRVIMEQLGSFLPYLYIHYKRWFWMLPVSLVCFIAVNYYGCYRILHNITEYKLIISSVERNVNKRGFGMRT